MVVYVAGQKVRASELNSGQPLFARTFSDITVNNSTTLVDATGLVLPMLASAQYILNGMIKYQSGTTPDIKFALIGPSGSGGSWGGHALQTGAADTSDSIETFCADAIGSGNVIGYGGGGSLNTMFFLRGLIFTTSTAGNLQVQFAQNTANASNTIVRNESWMTLQRVA